MSGDQSPSPNLFRKLFELAQAHAKLVVGLLRIRTRESSQDDVHCRGFQNGIFEGSWTDQQAKQIGPVYIM